MEVEVARAWRSLDVEVARCDVEVARVRGRGGARCHLATSA